MQIHTTDKPFNITKKQVYEAYKAVKSNAGSAGVDRQTIEQFDSDLRNNLYKLWNRMSSGSYFPPPVRAVFIPKKTGGQRILGVPTVADRVAQMVVKQLIEPDLDPIFLADSYGYRPRKSAHDAIGVTRKRCWKYDWVLEFDIKGLFDNIDHELLLRAVRRHVTCKWALLYIERWLTAPMEHADGLKAERTRGTPQGGVVSPILANLFLHYAFDLWMTRTHPDLPWCRYADDGLVHCRNEQEAQAVKAELHARLAECRLEMHPTKTKIVYCKDGKRNPLLRGWIEYGRYAPSALYPLLRYVNQMLLAWAMRKFRRFKAHKIRASRFLQKLSQEKAGLFVHWRLGMTGTFA
jgi:group II intron reverse transcriptase/maturase